MKRAFSHKTILWAGLVLWLVPALARIVLDSCGYNVPGLDMWFSALSNFKHSTLHLVVLVVFLVVILPIVEEFLFRYWILCRKKMATLALFAATGCYVAISSFWWLGIGGFLLCALIDYMLKGKPNTRTIALMLATSFLFALAHIHGYSEFNADTILAQIELFGLGLIACWLISNLGFWWACLLHSLNNTVAILFFLLMPTPLLYTPTAVEFDTPLYSASLQPMQGDTIDIRKINDSTMVFMGELPVIALNLVREFHPSIIDDLYSPTECFHTRPNFSYKAERPRWKYTLTFRDTIPYRHAPRLIIDLAKHSRLQIDTTYEYMYVIGIEDAKKLNESTGDVSSTLALLAEEIRIRYGCPVVLEKGTNEFYPIKRDRNPWPYPYDKNDLPAILKEKFGLFMYQSTVHKIQVISFSDHSK